MIFAINGLLRHPYLLVDIKAQNANSYFFPPRCALPTSISQFGLGSIAGD